MKRYTKVILRVISYILVAALASAVTLFLFSGRSKLDQLQSLLEDRFIGQTDSAAIEDAAARAMIQALGDRWSYYISADEYASYEESKNNAYVGIGVTIQNREDGQGFDVVKVEQGSPAEQSGVLPGDVIVAVEGQSTVGISADALGTLVRGKEGTAVSITVLRDGQTYTVAAIRKTIQVKVVTAQMLADNIGLISIVNFNEKCAKEAIEAIESLIGQGAQALVFDVRNNPGGYVSELTQLLDYLLPSGLIFRSEDYTGRQDSVYSDAHEINIPMAVLVNGESYSAAEYFAAALEEYDKAIVVGEQTVGKSYYQVTYRFPDGSAVGLSIGKYYTPKGVSLAEQGGLVPNIIEKVDKQTATQIYAGTLAPENDPQIQAAVEALMQK